MSLSYSSHQTAALTVSKADGQDLGGRSRLHSCNAALKAANVGRVGPYLVPEFRTSSAGRSSASACGMASAAIDCAHSDRKFEACAHPASSPGFRRPVPRRSSPLGPCVSLRRQAGRHGSGKMRSSPPLPAQCPWLDRCSPSSPGRLGRSGPFRSTVRTVMPARRADRAVGDGPPVVQIPSMHRPSLT